MSGTRSTAPTVARSLAVAGLLLALGLVGCSESSDPPAAGRLAVEGRAEVTRPGEDRRDVTGSRDLETGDRVRVREGTAVIRLPDDRRLDLRVGTDVEVRAAGGRPANGMAANGMRVSPALMGGDLLVISDRGPMVVTVPGAEVAVHGDARISRGVALLVGTYEGTAQLSAEGSTLVVSALRQASLPPTGQFPTGSGPLEYSPMDAWDQRYLSDAIELGSQLDARSQGFTAQLGPGEGRSFNYFRDLFPRLAAEPGFTAPLVNASRSPGETLVGAAITLEGARGTFAERWAAVFGFRDQGAPWGLVALDQGVSRVPLIESIEAAIGRGPAQFASGPPGTAPGSLARPSGGGPATTSAPPRTTPTTRPPTGAQATTTTTRPPTTPSPTTPGTTIVGPLNTGSPAIDNAVNSLVDTLTGLLNSLGQQ
jgi:hypothetical protein